MTEDAFAIDLRPKSVQSKKTYDMRKKELTELQSQQGELMQEVYKIFDQMKSVLFSKKI